MFTPWAAGDPITADKLKNTGLGYVALTGSANAYVATFAFTPTIADGISFIAVPNFTNTGSATLNPNALGAKTLKKQKNQNLASGDFVAGKPYLIVYDVTQDVYQVVGDLEASAAGFNTATVTYDSAGRIATIVDSITSKTYTFSYGTNGLVATITDATSTWTFAYNGAKQLTGVTKS